MKAIFLALTALATVAYAETFHHVEFSPPEAVQSWTKSKTDSTDPEGVESHISMYMNVDTKEIFTVVTTPNQSTLEELETGLSACGEQLKFTLLEKEEHSALYATSGTFAETEIAGWMRVLSSEAGTAVLTYQTVGGSELDEQWLDVLKEAHCL